MHGLFFSRLILLKIFSVASKVHQIAKKYGIKIESNYDKESNTFKPWNSWELNALASMSLEELVMISQVISVLDQEKLPPLQAMIRAHKKRIKMDFVKMDELPKTFYSICSPKDQDCITQNNEDFRKVYGSDLREYVLVNYYDLNRTPQLHQPEFDIHTSEQAQNWKQLTLGLLPYIRK